MLTISAQSGQHILKEVISCSMSFNIEEGFWNVVSQALEASAFQIIAPLGPPGVVQTLSIQKS